MKKKRLILLVVQVVLVIASVFFLISYTNKQVKLTPVYMYATNIDDVNYVVKETDIRMAEIPASAITSTFALNKDDIIGKQVDSSVKAGQYVYSDQLIDANQVDVFETMDLAGMRKISMPITMADSFSGNIKRGDLVDLLYTASGTKVDEGGYGENPYTYTKTFMQSVLVYQVNTEDGSVYIDNSQRVPSAVVVTGAEEATATEDGGNKPLSIITFAVTLEQAEEIEARLKTGSIRFIGRFEESEDNTPSGFVIGDAGTISLGKDDPEAGSENPNTNINEDTSFTPGDPEVNNDSDEEIEGEGFIEDEGNR